MPNLYELTAKHFIAENRNIAQLEERANAFAEKLGEEAREKFITAIFAEIHKGE